MSSPFVPYLISGLTVREACTDAIYRFLEGLDDNNIPVLRSALAPDAVFDMSRETGKETDKILGRDAIAEKLSKGVCLLDTLHQVTNVRVSGPRPEDSPDTARLTAYVLAQHKKPGTARDGHAFEALQGARYEVELVKNQEDQQSGDSGVYVIKNFVLWISWTRGDVPEVFGSN